MRTILLCMCALLLAATAFAAAPTPVVTANPDTHIAYTNPVWSPNGQSIACVGLNYKTNPTDYGLDQIQPNIYLATASGSSWKSRLLVKSADWPVWSSNGRQLAFNQGGLAIMDMNTGKVKQISKDKSKPTEPDVAIHYPLSWSPNGSYLQYAVAYYEGSEGFIANLKSVKLPGTPVGEEAVWMTDGKLLSTKTVDTEGTKGQMLITDPATGKSRKVLEGPAMHRPFVPKGAGYAWVWIQNNAPKGEGIYRVDLKTGVLTKQIGVHVQELYWSQDAQQFAFISMMSMRRGEEPRPALYIGSTRNWYFKVLAKDAAQPSANWHDRMRYAAWSPNSKSIAYVTSTGDIKVVKL